MRDGWPRYALERYSLLKKWRDLVDIVARACKEVLSDECVGVYVVGGIAEGRPTVLSDIDVVVVVSNAGLKSLEAIIALRRRSEELGVPIDAPIDIKILTKEEFKKLIDEGTYRKTLKVL